MEIELERTFLLKEFPNSLKQCENVEILDVYIPETGEHPILRIRKRGNSYEITKKAPLRGTDSSEQYEKTIPLTVEEFNDLAKIKGKRLRKRRFYYSQEDKKIKMEVDVYLDGLKGLALVDFEFQSKEEKNNFLMPDFCLADVTQEKAFAAGMLAGKRYSEIDPFLDKYSYKKISLLNNF